MLEVASDVSNCRSLLAWIGESGKSWESYSRTDTVASYTSITVIVDERLRRYKENIRVEVLRVGVLDLDGRNAGGNSIVERVVSDLSKWL